MSFVVRRYPDIVQDVLTTLTKGVSAEHHQVAAYDPDARPVIIPDVMFTARPARRVSVVRGWSMPQPGAEPVEVLFSLNEYELIPTATDPDVYDGIRFRPLAKRKPAPGSTLTVNYYPRSTDHTPITDLNVGSVARTIVEAMSRELAGLYVQLGIAYDSAFVDTATGASLDQVVALLDRQRFRAGHAVGTVTFNRRASATGSISIPAGTLVTDVADKVRYVTSERFDMQAGESVAKVRVQGALRSTRAVEAGELAVVQRAIAGIESVTNEAATVLSTADESDEALRARTRDALIAANKGTLEAMQHGLLALPDVTSVSIVEMPNGVAGEIAVSVQLREQSSELPGTVTQRIEELRPAGIKVIQQQAAVTKLAALVSLVLAGSSRTDPEIEDIKRGVKAKLVAYVRDRPVGQLVRSKPVVAALLGDQRIADLTLGIGPVGQPAADGTDFQPGEGAGVALDDKDIGFGPLTYADPLAPAGPLVRVELRASIGATPVGGTSLDDIRTQLKERLTAYARTLRPGISIDANAILGALRDDARFAIDPLKLSVTLTALEQFVTIAVNAPPFEVMGNQQFVVIAVELRQ